jgi:uncharacterized membrane protein YkvA (DUF1232 family)
MPELKITFTLSNKDVSHLRRMIRKATHAAAGEDEASILGAAERLTKQVGEAKPPSYVMERVEKLKALVRMVQDEDYAILPGVRKKVLGALAYFSAPADLIPDAIPGLGFLDDAIMVELVAQDLRHELAGYRKFCDYRETAVQRPWTQVGKERLARKLVEKRKQIREEIRKRQARDAERSRSGSSFFKTLW